MRHLLMTVVIVSLGGVAPGAALAQESTLAADLRRERERLADKCGLSLKEVFGCTVALVTDHPFHLAVGSIAPQNGFAVGLAFVPPQRAPSENWRINWSADAVRSFKGAWRAGVYMTFVSARVPEIGVVRPGEGTEASRALPRPYPTITAYVQAASLPKLSYFGLGNDSLEADRSGFAMRQTVAGTRVVWPIGRSGALNRLGLSLVGEVNGRWVRLRGGSVDGEPSIETLFTDETAPGLSDQPATVQFSEGVRVTPALGRLQLIYMARLQQYVAPSDPAFSFRRWEIDLQHDFSLYTTSREAGAREFNTPNDCSTSVDRSVGEYGCPDPTRVTTNRVGTIGIRALVSRSDASGDGRVPFYFMRTLGGSDVDGERLLASYDDYRFRAPNLILFQQTFEHVIWGPLGAFAAAEQGRVSLIDDPLTDGDFRNTFGAGLTLRAGGVPMITAWWAHGSEGHHVALTMSTFLFGGSSRPSLR